MFTFALAKIFSLITSKNEVKVAGQYLPNKTACQKGWAYVECKCIHHSMKYISEMTVLMLTCSKCTV
jgi:hypothetical protein